MSATRVHLQQSFFFPNSVRSKKYTEKLNVYSEKPFPFFYRYLPAHGRATTQLSKRNNPLIFSPIFTIPLVSYSFPTITLYPKECQFYNAYNTNTELCTSPLPSLKFVYNFRSLVENSYRLKEFFRLLFSFRFLLMLVFSYHSEVVFVSIASSYRASSFTLVFQE